MKKYLSQLLAVAAAVLILAAPLYAAWKEKVTRNQLKAREYIQKLMDGADPAEVQRPHLRYDDNFEAKRSLKEVVRAMDEAEELARAGKHQLIEQPEFHYKGIPEERYEELQREKKSSY